MSIYEKGLMLREIGLVGQLAKRRWISGGYHVTQGRRGRSEGSLGFICNVEGS